MCATRSQKRRIAHQESTDKVSEGLFSPVLAKTEVQEDQGVKIAGPTSTKSPRIGKTNKNAREEFEK